MPQDIKIWEITDKDQLKEVPRSQLNLEERLENWIEKDISIISDDLLVIGRQINTDFGGIIDLLCLNSSGDIAVLELKKDKTPREITAQALDYASWVKELSNERITDIANGYLGGNNFLEEAFKNKFGIDFPEVLNENHKILIIASEIDSSSERIIGYLSSSYGIDINAVTFQYFQRNKEEYLSRVFLIEPGEAEYRAKTKSYSKRRPNLTYEQLERVAEEKGVADSYKKFTEGLSSCVDYSSTTRSSIAFIGLVGKSKQRRTLLSVIPGNSSQKNGLHYEVYIDRFADYLDTNKENIKSIFPSYSRKGDRDNGEFGEGYFKDKRQIDDFLEHLHKLKHKKQKKK